LLSFIVLQNKSFIRIEDPLMLKLTIVKEKCSIVKKTRMKGVCGVYYDGCGLYDIFSNDPM
jgi:hypothetical protein